MSTDAVDILNQVDRVSLIAGRGRIIEQPNARAAFATRGGPGFAALLCQRFEKATSLAELRAMAPMTLRAAQHALQVADPAAGEALVCKVSMIGWDDDGPVAFTIGTDRFRVTDVPYLNAAPAPVCDDLLMLVTGGVEIDEDEDWQAIDTAAAALRLIAARDGFAPTAERVTIDAAGLHRLPLPPFSGTAAGHD